jgi:hypothetical protein
MDENRPIWMKIIENEKKNLKIWNNLFIFKNLTMW